MKIVSGFLTVLSQHNHIHKHTHTLTCMHAHSHTHIFIQIPSPANTHTYICTVTTRVHTHKHIYSLTGRQRSVHSLEAALQGKEGERREEKNQVIRKSVQVSALQAECRCRKTDTVGGSRRQSGCWSCLL